MIPFASYLFLLFVPAAFLFYRHFLRKPTLVVASNPASDPAQPEQPRKTIMQAPSEDLAPPKDDPFTLEQLKEYDGSDPSKPIYLSIKGTVFNVTKKKDVYGPGGSYSIFAGKDGSKGLGMSSLKPETAVPDYSDLDEKDRKVLDDWHSFFTKRYNIVGRVIDHPTPPDA